MSDEKRTGDDQAIVKIQPRTMAEAREMGDLFADSALIPKALQKKAVDVTITILAGAELGIGPMAALRGIHVVEGKPYLAADLMVGLVLQSGLCEYFELVEGDDRWATFATKRIGTKREQRFKFTIDDAKRAGLLGKHNWKCYPGSMLKARAKSILARDVYPDVLAGVYSREERDDFIDVPESAIYERPEAPSVAAVTAAVTAGVMAEESKAERATTREQDAPVGDSPLTFEDVKAALESGDVGPDMLALADTFKGEERDALMVAYKTGLEVVERAAEDSK